ncbi:DUF4291 domain-containing protein [Streptomyces candidus]|uniref:DUF4291 domain-containing protein n=1 Tax=Streptomyces candidus TaxID=67283 RepID=A0A7X0HBX9_9ACTN|nr:DUF4291 domain-containing protein [Streptomyces candidus]MBB6434784.1 hypothetical protein [Streptomyces candidus]GHH41910.1 hypothetical protein GCM10018773_25870 [Streptomyces candidus]
MPTPHVPQRQVRALHTAETVTVYQAYPPSIGLPAAASGRFPAAWKRERMTWIKPSFLWMMYRCGWATKQDQEVVLAVEIRREGFDWALAHACLAHHEHGVHADRAAWKQALRGAPARVQWDPERDVRLQPLPYRSLQLGLSGEAVRRYADEWIVGVRDVTPLARTVAEAVAQHGAASAEQLLPVESPYPVSDGGLRHLGAD